MARKYWWIFGLLAAVIVVFVLAPAASSDPDGLDRVAEDKEFAEQAEEPRYEWLPDYSVPGVDDEYWSLVLAGTIGVGIVFGLMMVMGFAMSRARASREAQARAAEPPQTRETLS